MANRSLGVLTVDLIMKLGGFKEGADQATRQFDKMTKGIKSSAGKLGNEVSGIGKSFAGLGLAIVGGLGIAEIIHATSQAEEALAKLDQAVKNNGGSAGRSTQELVDMSGALQQISVFADEDIQSMQSLLLRFNSISGENLDRATLAVLDLSSALGKDLETVALSVGRALEDPEKGLKKLARAGIIFSESQQAIVKGFLDTGEKAKAQSYILDEIEKKFGDAAAAARNNFGGALKGVKNAFGDLLEVKGGLPGVVGALNTLTEVLADPTTKQAVESFFSLFVKGATLAIIDIAKLVNLLSDTVNGLMVLAGQGGNAFVDLDNKIRDLEEKRANFNPFVLWGPSLEEINKQLADAKAKQAAMMGLRDPFAAIQARIAAENAPAGPVKDGIKVLSPGDQEFIDKQIEDNVTQLEKLQAELDAVQKKHKEGIYVGEEYTKSVTRLTGEIAKLKEKSSGQNKVATEIDQARKKVDDLISSLEDQAATYGLTEREAFKYKITQGDIGDALAKLGKEAGPLRDKLLALYDAGESKKATDSINDQVNAWNEQIATMGLSEDEAIQYSITQGVLAESLGKTGTAAEELKKKLEDSAAALAAARKKSELTQEGKSIFEATRTDAEKYEIQLKKLDEVLKAGGINQDTYGRAVGNAVVDYIHGADAAETYRLQLEEINRLLAEGTVTQEEASGAIAHVKDVYAKAGEEASKAFIDEAKRNTQDILANYIENGFKGGIDGLLKNFDDMFMKIGAQALATKLADKLFDGFDDWIKMALDALKKLFAEMASGSGSFGGGGSGIWSTLGSWGSKLLGGFGGGASAGLSEINITATKIPGYAEGGLATPLDFSPSFAPVFAPVFSPVSNIAAPSGSFASLGFTGAGTKYQPVGVVHANEYVMPMERVKEPGALSFLEAFHAHGMSLLRGYVSGGLVTSRATSHAAGWSSAMKDGNTSDAPIEVTNNFYISAPNGTVSAATQQQLAAAAMRGLAHASRRNN